MIMDKYINMCIDKIQYSNNSNSSKYLKNQDRMMIINIIIKSYLKCYSL